LRSQSNTSSCQRVHKTDTSKNTLHLLIYILTNTLQTHYKHVTNTHTHTNTLPTHYTLQTHYKHITSAVWMPIYLLTNTPQTHYKHITSMLQTRYKHAYTYLLLIHYIKTQFRSRSKTSSCQRVHKVDIKKHITSAHLHTYKHPHT